MAYLWLLKLFIKRSAERTCAKKEGMGRGKVKGTKKAMKGKGKRMRICTKMEKIIIAAIILAAFVGTVKNRYLLQTTRLHRFPQTFSLKEKLYQKNFL